MTVARPIVAVIPFGARGTTPRAGAWARQLAARLVERFAQAEAVDVRPVFLVAMPEASSEAGYLVFGSSPDAGLAAEYGRSLGATYALTGIYREDGGTRRLEVTLVDVGSGAVRATRSISIDAGDARDDGAGPRALAGARRRRDAHDRRRCSRGRE
jgi:TolB-like protein